MTSAGKLAIAEMLAAEGTPTTVLASARNPDSSRDARNNMNTYNS